MDWIFSEYGVVYDSEIKQFVIIQKELFVKKICDDCSWMKDKKEILDKGFFENMSFHAGNEKEIQFERNVNSCLNNLQNAWTVVLEDVSKKVSEEDVMRTDVWAEYYEESKKNIALQM